MGEIIEREGDLSRVQPEFAGLVDDFVRRCRAAFDDDLHSLYLYGSIPRGTARPGLSDLDGQVLLRRPPTERDRQIVTELEQSLGADHPEVIFVGILLDDLAALTDPADRHDGGFHLRVLCTPVWGPDAGALVEPHEMDLALVLGVQGDWRGALEGLREQATSVTGEEIAPFCRSTGRRLARIATAWVQPRWGRWTSDPEEMLTAVRTWEPTWLEPMRDAVALGWEGSTDLDRARALLEGWATELWARGEELEQELAATGPSVRDGRVEP